MYTFDQSSDSAAQYEAHSDAQVCLKFKLLFALDNICMQIEHQSKQKEEKKYFVDKQLPCKGIKCVVCLQDNIGLLLTGLLKNRWASTVKSGR